MTQTILSLRALYKTRLQETGFTLRIPCFEVAKGECVALVGPSGCGKSTALDILGTVLCPDTEADAPACAKAGGIPLPVADSVAPSACAAVTANAATAHAATTEITAADASEFCFTPAEKTIDILSLWRKNSNAALAKLRRRHMGYILQTGGLLPFLSAWDNILMGRDKDTADRARILAEKLDISQLLRRLPAQISVGQRQRVAIARALAGAPPLLLADEPAAALDPVNARVVLEMFTSLAQEMGVTVIMVTHAPESARAMGFRMESLHVQQDGQHVTATLGGAPC